MSSNNGNTKGQNNLQLLLQLVELQQRGPLQDFQQALVEYDGKIHPQYTLCTAVTAVWQNHTKRHVNSSSDLGLCRTTKLKCC